MKSVSAVIFCLREASKAITNNKAHPSAIDCYKKDRWRDFPMKGNGLDAKLREILVKQKMQNTPAHKSRGVGLFMTEHERLFFAGNSNCYPHWYIKKRIGNYRKVM
jgi:hypothetical protein